MAHRVDITFPVELDVAEVNLAELAERSGYSTRYVAKLAGQGRIVGVLRHDHGAPPRGRWVFHGTAVFALRARRVLTEVQK